MEKRVCVGINGFGRIGRLVFRAIWERHRDRLQVVAINDLATPEMNAHLLKYDSTYGRFNGRVELVGGKLKIDGELIQMHSEKEIADLPWGSDEVALVIEATGQFTDAIKARKHIDAGAKRVIISAPSKNADITVVLGVNHKLYDPKKHFVVSNASCTTNSLAPVAKVLNEEFIIE